MQLAAVQRLFTWSRILDPSLATRYAHHIRPLWLEAGKCQAFPDPIDVDL